MATQEQQTKNLIELITKGINGNDDPFKNSVLEYIRTKKEKLPKSGPLPAFTDDFKDQSQRDLIYYAKAMPASNANIIKKITVFDEADSPVNEHNEFTLMFPVRLAYDVMQDSNKNILHFEFLNAHVQINYNDMNLLINGVGVILPGLYTKWFNNYHVLTIVYNFSLKSVVAHLTYYTSTVQRLSTVKVEADINKAIPRRPLNMYIESDKARPAGSIPISISQWFPLAKKDEDILDISKSILLGNNEALDSSPEEYVISCFEQIFSNSNSRLPMHDLNVIDTSKALDFLTTKLIEMAGTDCEKLFEAIINKYCNDADASDNNPEFCSLIQCQVCFEANKIPVHVPCQNPHCGGFIVCSEPPDPDDPTSKSSKSSKSCLDKVFTTTHNCIKCRTLLTVKPVKPKVKLQKMIDEDPVAKEEKRKQEEKHKNRKLLQMRIPQKVYMTSFFFPALLRAQACVTNMQEISGVYMRKMKLRDNRVKLLFDFLKKLLACQQDPVLSAETDEWIKSRRIQKLDLGKNSFFNNFLRFCATRAQIIFYDFPTAVFETGSTGYQYNSYPLIPTKELSPELKDLECALFKYIDKCTYLRMENHFDPAWYLLSSPFKGKKAYIEWEKLDEYTNRHSSVYNSEITLSKIAKIKNIKDIYKYRNQDLVNIILDYRKLMFHLMYTECFCAAYCTTADAHLNIKIEAFKTIADIINLEVAARAASTRAGLVVEHEMSSALLDSTKYAKILNLNLYLLAMTNLTRRLQIGYVSGTDSDGKPILENPYIIVRKQTKEDNFKEIRDKLLHKRIHYVLETHSDLGNKVDSIFPQATPEAQATPEGTAFRIGNVKTLPPLQPQPQPKPQLFKPAFPPSGPHGGAPENRAWIYASLVVAIVATSVNSILQVPS